MYSEIIKIIHNVFNFWMQKHFIGSEYSYIPLWLKLRWSGN